MSDQEPAALRKRHGRDVLKDLVGWAFVAIALVVAAAAATDAMWPAVILLLAAAALAAPVWRMAFHR